MSTHPWSLWWPTPAWSLHHNSAHHSWLIPSQSLPLNSRHCVVSRHLTMSFSGAPATCSSCGHTFSPHTQVDELHKGRATWLVHAFSTLPCGQWATSSRSGQREKEPGCPALGRESPRLRLHFSASKNNSGVVFRDDLRTELTNATCMGWTSSGTPPRCDYPVPPGWWDRTEQILRKKAYY